MAWASDCRSRAPSSRRMADKSRPSPIRAAAPSSASRCARWIRRSSEMPSDVVVHVVDDDEAVRASLSFLLRTANLDVKTYDSASALLNAPPSSGCVITDVRMPDVSGIELLRRLRELQVAVPVIV